VTDRPGFRDAPIAPIKPTAEPAIPDRGWVAGPTAVEGPVRHAPAPDLPPAPPPAGVGTLWLAGGALIFLTAAVAGLQLANFTAAQFDRADWLGWLTLALLAPGLAVLAWSGWRELRGLTALESVDRLRHDLASDDPVAARAAARRWLAAIATGPEALQVIQSAPDAATIRAMLRAGPLARLDIATAEAGKTAALQVLAVVAVSPWPGLDGAIMVWRGLRLVRQVARLHGMRPGTLGTLRLFRRVALDAGAVAATDVVVTALADALFHTPLVSVLAGQGGASLLAARRMLRLAVAVGQACRPV
jgi:putative membrane protein